MNDKRHRKRLCDLYEIDAGVSVSRLMESEMPEAKTYGFYTAGDAELDLRGVNKEFRNLPIRKTVNSSGEYSQLKNGDLLFNSMNQKASVVSDSTCGLITGLQFYLLKPKEGSERMIYGKYLVYLLNESSFVREQIEKLVTGSSKKKLSLKDFRELELPSLPDFHRQKQIGDMYFEILSVSWYRKLLAERERDLCLQALNTLEEKNEKRGESDGNKE